MIFVTVGTTSQGFDRLVRGVDAIAPEFEEPIRAQIGEGGYIPENIEWFRFTSEEEIQEVYRTASVVIAHAGAGTVLTAISYGKPIIILPRRKKYGEHNDDHQMELATTLSDRPDVQVVLEVDELKPAIRRARPRSKTCIAQDQSLVQFLSGYLNNHDS